MDINITQFCKMGFFSLIFYLYVPDPALVKYFFREK